MRVSLLVLLIPSFLFAISIAQAGPALDRECAGLRANAEIKGIIPSPWVEPELIASALNSAEAQASWQRYQENVAAVAPKLPLGNSHFEKKVNDGVPIPPEIAKWTKDMNEIMGDRDRWVKWNIGFAERIRARSRAKFEPIFESMMAEFKAESEARGFGSEILILKTGREWRTMLREGKVFVDTFTDRGTEYDHTEIVHANQLLYLQLMLEARGYPPGEMSKIMKEFLGNDALVESLQLVDSTTGQVDSQFTSPWYDLFDAGTNQRKQAAHPEWFGLIGHLVANGIPYQQIRERIPTNYPRTP